MLHTLSQNSGPDTGLPPLPGPLRFALSVTPITVSGQRTTALALYEQVAPIYGALVSFIQQHKPPSPMTGEWLSSMYRAVVRSVSSFYPLPPLAEAPPDAAQAATLSDLAPHG